MDTRYLSDGRIDISRDGDIDEKEPAVVPAGHRRLNIPRPDHEAVRRSAADDDISARQGSRQIREGDGARRPPYLRRQLSRALKRPIGDDDLRSARVSERPSGQLSHASGADDEDRFAG